MMTVEEYLAAEEKAEVRHEYIDGQVFAMTGATDAHNVICSNLLALFHSFLRGSGCRAYINDMKVRVETSNCFYYPDIMVTCEPFEAKSVYKAAPVLILEVLSPSTSAIDRREKLLQYRNLESLREYVLVYQDRRLLDVYQKDSSGSWNVLRFKDADSITLQSMPCGEFALSLNDVYEGVL